jgi:hypothetical protein
VRIAGGLTGTPLPPEPAALGPDILSPGDVASRQPDPAARKSAVPVLSRLRVSGRPRVCRRKGCQARTATLSFKLAAAADVTARLQRRHCVKTRCRWRPARERQRRAPAGTTRWTVGQQLLGMALRRGTWRVTLVTSAGSARRDFRVR